MSLKAKIDHPDFPKGQKMYIDGLGEFENGKERTIKADEEEGYVARTGKTVKEGLKGNEFISVEGTTEAKKGGES